MKIISRVLDTELRTPKIPEGFTLVIDTREQLPLFTDIQDRIPDLTIIHAPLALGDYSIKGFTRRITVERKTISDFYAYIGRDRKRTEDKLRQLSEYDFVALAIEGTEDDVLSQHLCTLLSPEHARGFLVSWEVKYGFHTYFGTRRSIERWILDRFIKYYNLKRAIQ